MKKFVLSVGVLCVFLPRLAVAQPEEPCQGWTCNIKYTLGLAGVGFFFNQTEKEYVANIGGLIRIVYPVIQQERPSAKIDLIDVGLMAYVTAGEVKGKTAFFGGGGLTVGFIDGLLSFSFGPCLVYADEPNFDGRLFWGLIFTSQAVSIR